MWGQGVGPLGCGARVGQSWPVGPQPLATPPLLCPAPLPSMHPGIFKQRHVCLPPPPSLQPCVPGPRDALVAEQARVISKLAAALMEGGCVELGRNQEVRGGGGA